MQANLLDTRPPNVETSSKDFKSLHEFKSQIKKHHVEYIKHATNEYNVSDDQTKRSFQSVMIP